MLIHFDHEIKEITNQLDHAEGYLDCEKIITRHIKEKLDHDFDDEEIMVHLRKLSAYYCKKIESDQGHADCSNYRYAAGYAATLLKMPYWRNWM